MAVYKKQLSIIIPCYNHGNYINEAIDSINPDNINISYEVIIVDDGSTEPDTLLKLEILKKRGYFVIHQPNGGPANARNTGIEKASGKYILPLDADNKIHQNYINKAIPFLESNNYDIVYAKPIFIGENKIKRRKYKVWPFDDLKIVTGNCADACAIYRKEVWIKNMGYDESIPFRGFEDWEFWINAAANGNRFHMINEKLFFYRIIENSVIANYSDENKIVINHQYIAKKHANFFLEKLLKLNYIRERYENDIRRFPITSIVYFLYQIGVIEHPVDRARKKFLSFSSIKRK